MRPLALLLSILGFAFAVGCGSVGEPLYPALNIPARITDLVAVERGDNLDISFTIPLRTTEGMLVKQIGSVELRVGSNDQKGFQIDQWASTAKQLDVSPVSPPGQRQTARIAIRDSIGKDLIVAARTSNAKGRESDWSSLVVVSVEQPLAKPSNFKAEAVPQGVWLSWTAQNITDFRLYKKGPNQNAPVLLATFADHGFLDTEVELDKTYEYYVEGFHEKIASEIVGPAEVTPADSFAPAAPSGLTASNGIGAIELAWERNTEPRFKEYRLYRSEDNGPFTPIAQGLDVPSYSDHNVQSGKHYRYQLVAVGQNGLASQPSDPIEAVAP
jgi:hypothetical protein